MTNEAINQESVNESVNESVVVDNAINAIVAKATSLNKKARREAAKQAAAKADTAKADTAKAVKADTAKAAKADTAKAAKADTAKAAKADTAKAVKADTAQQSFFNVEETEKAIALEIENKEAVKAAKAAKAAKASHSEKLLVSSLTRSNTRYIYTNTAIVNIALLVAARSIERASCNQIAAYIEKVLKCDNIRHKSDSSNAHRVLAHCKDALAAYVTCDNDVITFNELLVKTAKLESMIVNVDQLASKLIAANS